MNVTEYFCTQTAPATPLLAPAALHPDAYRVGREGGELVYRCPNCRYEFRRAV